MGLKSLVKLKLEQRDRNRLFLALEEGERLTLFLKEILLYAKPQKLELAQIEVKPFLDEILASLKEMPLAKDKEIYLDCEREKFTLRGDRLKLKQVFINLIQNALEASPPDQVVSCTIKQNPNSNNLKVSIHNWGTPIPQEILPKLCEPFVSNKSGGTGLGLAIVKQIIKAHQGALSIESNPTQGTTISFTIPL